MEMLETPTISQISTIIQPSKVNYNLVVTRVCCDIMCFDIYIIYNILHTCRIEH